jgi:hypothetical protein
MDEVKFCNQCKCKTWFVDGVCEWSDIHKRETPVANLNLGNDNVFEQTLTVDEIRNADQSEAESTAFWEKITGWLDDAQAPVFTDEHKTTYLVIEITK